jgi:hypothetical protein
MWLMPAAHREVSLCLGYEPDVPEGETEVGGIGGLSLGYTWRRK